jgi:3'-phosphoadenosine 5'-phosphosulfate (PAPS) 3'-phosphatase
MSSFLDYINLHSLVSECASLALLAGGVIRSVHTARLEGGNAVLNGHLKEEGDKKSVATVADVRAQRIIVDALRRKFPGVAIVGEEDDDASVPAGEGDNATTESVAMHPFMASNCLEAVRLKGETVKRDSIVIYIDPLDGTHEFVEGRVMHVQTLIGIAVNGYPVAGIVGLPFWGQEVVSLPASEAGTEAVAGQKRERGLDITMGGTTGGAVIAGVVGVDTFGFLPVATTAATTAVATASTNAPLRLASSSSIKDPALQAVQSVLTAAPFSGVPSTVPACGNKVLSLLRGENDVAVFNLKTSLWDACATQACLVAAGGRVTDLTGSCINYGPPSIVRNGKTGNVYGVLCTVAGVNHADITARFRKCPEVTALLGHCGLLHSTSSTSSSSTSSSSSNSSDGGTASDICRDTNGMPITCQTLSVVMGLEVGSYTCPEAEAQRYLMSEAARMHVSYRSGSDTTGRPSSVFYKRAVMR